jgi:hypothetical protein
LPPSYSGDASTIEARSRSSEIVARTNVLSVFAPHSSQDQGAPEGVYHHLKACSQQARGWRCFAAAGQVWHQYRIEASALISKLLVEVLEHVLGVGDQYDTSLEFKLRFHNTETSTLLAKAEWQNSDTYSAYYGTECKGELYQTRGGAFFVVTTTHIPETRDSEGRDKVECDAMTPEQAQKWLLDGDVEVFRNPFEDPPEAEAETDTGATIYVRMPAALKHAVDAAAEKAGVSVNVWAMRCVERCLDDQKAA